MKYNELLIKISSVDGEKASAVAAMLDIGGLYLEDYSDSFFSNLHSIFILLAITNCFSGRNNVTGLFFLGDFAVFIFTHPNISPKLPSSSFSSSKISAMISAEGLGASYL